MTIDGHLRPADVAGPRPEQHRRLGPQRRPHGHGRSPTKSPFTIDIVAAQGAAGPQRLDGPEGRRHARRRLHRADLACTCSTTRRASARRASIAIPEGQNEAVDSADGQRRRGDRHVEDRRASAAATVGNGAGRRCSSQLADLDDRRAVLQRSPSTRPPSSRARKPTSSIKVEKNKRLRRHRQGRAARPARRSHHDDAARVHQGHDRAGLHGQDRRPSRPAGQLSRSLICRADDHGQRRAGHAHAGHRRAADRHAAAAQADAPPPRRRCRCPLPLPAADARRPRSG